MMRIQPLEEGTPRMTWPHQDDGTVDWETVFDDEDTGLTKFAERARTTAALARCAHVIVQSLFIRDDDPPYREAFNVAIDELVEDESQDDQHKRDKILKLIHEIKLNRVERAGVYIENGGADANGEERRLEADEPTKPLAVLKEELEDE